MSKVLPSEFSGTNWIDDEERAAVLDVVESGALFRYYGPNQPTHVAALETLAKQFYGVPFALGVNGGTGGLIVTMSALGIGPGDEVIVPTFLWVSIVGAVVACNAIPVLCEVDETFSMSPSDLKKKITSRTKLIVAAHMAGAPCDIVQISEIAESNGIYLLEDCAQCNGGSVAGKMVGTYGTVGMFSFQINKNITSGEGGLLVTSNEELYWRLNAVHDVGVPWKGAEPAIEDPINLWGQGRRMSELCGAVANVQLKKLSNIVNSVSNANARVRSALADLPGVELRRIVDSEGNTGSFVVLILPNSARARAVAAKLATMDLRGSWRISDYGLHVYFNIPQLVNHTPLSAAGNPWNLPQNKGLERNYARGACPASDDLFDRSIIITLPSRLSADQEAYIIDSIRRSLEN